VLAAGLAVALTPLEIVAGSNFGIGVQLQHFRVDESWYFEDEDQSIDPASWLLGASLLSTTRSGHFVHEVEVSVSATVGGEKLQAPFTSGRTLLFSLRWGAGWAPLQF
jgi:hypothetical protein